jgi:tRNA threonylcarbamoyladenosine biosynthesis protein TsaE
MLEEIQLLSEGPDETRAVGDRLGRCLRPGDCLALTGQLGAGKTTLVQGIVAGAGGEQDVRSPTFLLHSIHPGRVTIHHLDLYRLPDGVDLASLGLDEHLEQGAALVEWGERAAPGWYTGEVELALLGERRRRITLRLPAELAREFAGG